MKLPVMFRWFGGEVTAVFPSLPYSQNEPDADITCYAHIGQHGCASWVWVADTRPATSIEYEDLHGELMQIYSDCELLIV